MSSSLQASRIELSSATYTAGFAIPPASHAHADPADPADPPGSSTGWSGRRHGPAADKENATPIEERPMLQCTPDWLPPA